VKLPHGLRALRHRDFRLFFAGQGTSQLGTWLQLIATSWLVYRLSGSTFLLGLAAFAIQIPFLVLAPIAGVLVDRHDARRVLLVTNSVAAGQATVMLALVVTGRVEAWHLVAGNLVLGILNACDSPARQALLIRLVGGRADLPNAIALNSTMMNGARFLGPMLGGALIAALGEPWAFGINALSYSAMLAALWRIRSPFSRREPSGESLVRQLSTGAAWAWNFLPARSALLLNATTSLSVGSYVSMLPWFAREAFHGDSRTLGFLISAAGFGAVSGMIYLATRPSVRGLFRLIGATSAIAGAGLLAFAASGSFWVALPSLTAVGMGLMLTAASTNTLLQSIVPDELRGRVASLYVMSFIGVAPLGALATGWASERIGPPVALAACGAIALVAALAYVRRLPAIRREIRPVYERIGL
jgi:MFS family permease